ncbi:hypothetical protein PKB_3103 [Pseudomonas knackmussii B13]|uniref:Phage tail collar domain-containing protein n=1 Tax=Pseudomonas knackmussii (strain DSM 6978 / CCUG 54928 / LMG 23759 / B13) TaxID=1301098 RepID=A0A024HHE6_PSEKB|nr:tail fiber protein [Pseudomonas knackmussii]CDF84450.1 hypothetical protein PKB_3103 [Pseudomonas knackmussii B13]
MEVFIGTIIPFGFNFAPRGWATCSGQLLPISQYSAVFALLGTMYGGNGQTNFGLPDLRGRTPLSYGQGLGLSNYELGQVGGTESVTLLSSNLPPHSLNVNVQLATTASSPASVPSSANSYLGASGGGQGTATIYSDAQGANPVTLKGASATFTGGGVPVSIQSPFLALNFCICLEGIFPSRD